MLKKWLVCLTVLTLTVTLAGEAGANTRNEVDLQVTGLDDNQQLSGTVTFNINVGTQAASVYAYTNRLPDRDGTSYLIGQWSTRRSRSIRAVFDTRYVPDGVHSVTVFVRDRENRVISIRSFSVAVQNFGTEQLTASHLEIERPTHMDSQKGNTIEVRLREFKTGEIASVTYRVTPLGLFRPQDIVSNEGKIAMRGLQPGWYAVSAWAYDSAGRAIDRSTVTLYFDPGK